MRLDTQEKTTISCVIACGVSCQHLRAQRIHIKYLACLAGVVAGKGLDANRGGGIDDNRRSVMNQGLVFWTLQDVADSKPSLLPLAFWCFRRGLSSLRLFPLAFSASRVACCVCLLSSFNSTLPASACVSWGFDAMGRGEVGVTARWHYDKHFTRRPTVLGSTFMGSKAKVRRRVSI